jgi:YidC/Oxa1 family membrane protein insertase
MQFDQRPPTDQRRMLIFFALALPIWIAGLMWMQRGQESAERQTPQQEAPEPSIADGGGFSGPQLQPADKRPQPPAGDAEPLRPIRRRTDLETVKLVTESFEIEFSPSGAVPVRWTLVDTRATNGRHKSRRIRDEGAAPGEAGEGIDLIDPDLAVYGLPLPFEFILKELNAKFYHELNRETYEVTQSKVDGHQVIRFESPVTESGLKAIKTYRVPERGFQGSLEIELVNTGESRLTFNHQGQGLGLAMGPGLGKAPPPEPGFGGAHYEYTRPFYRRDAAIIGLKTRKPDEPEIFVDPQGRIDLAGIQSRYFMMGVLPGETFPEGKGFSSGRGLVTSGPLDVALASKDTIEHYPRLEVYDEPFTLEPGGEYRAHYLFFVGPKERTVLRAAGLGLDRLLFYDSWGWMRALCFILMEMLGFFHRIFTSWGLAIIALVITVRLLTFPLTQIGMKHQAAMMAQQAKLKPFLDKINEKYKDNPTKRNQEMMKLYREHNVNPFGMLKGCMWMLIQLPIFFALYKLLSQDFDLRGASFLWIEDLSKADRLFQFGFSIPWMGEYFNLLPIMTAATQMLVSKLTMNPQAVSDPQQAAIQKQMMYMMPIMILVMTYHFPSGLCLYWMISNVWQVLQQRFVNRRYLPAPAPAASTS